MLSNLRADRKLIKIQQLKNHYSQIIMLTVTQYAKALSTLSDKRKAILFKMYRQGPFADSNVIAQILGYKGFTAVNLQLGSIGKYISDVIGVPSNYYYDYKGGKRLAYFHFVHYWTGEVWYLQPNAPKTLFIYAL